MSHPATWTPTPRRAPATADSEFLEDVLAGLSSRPPSIPAKYFYDREGSRLFDAITELPEYYLTRTELLIMRRSLGEIASSMGSRIVLIEYGSGSSVKTRMLLDQLADGSAYVPIDISRDHLQATAAELAADYPHIRVEPVHADYSSPVDLPGLSGRRVVYYPGSTIGNFEPCEAEAFLRRLRCVVGDEGAILVGVDLTKDKKILEAAYNDSRGVTARFNLNLLTRINRELGANFDTSGFRHRAVFVDDIGRIEMHLVCLSDQTVSVARRSFSFRKGDYIHTENSYKYTIDQFSAVTKQAGFEVSDMWSDERQWFGMFYLTAAKTGA